MNDTLKKAMDSLLNNTWIVKEQDPTLYYSIKNNGKELKQFFTTFLGSKLIITQKLIKLEKVPVSPRSSMGITGFTEKLEYILLLLSLLYLEDKTPGDQFILSNLANFILTTSTDLKLENMPNWERMHDRKCMVNVLNYLKEIYIIRVREEEKISFTDNAHSEGLYETTGISNYLMRQFKNEIFSYQALSDFQKDEWSMQEEEKGSIRRYRVYRSLVYAPVVYTEDLLPSDIEYIKQQRFKIKSDLEQILECDTIFTKNMSMILYEDSFVKHHFPNTKNLTDLVLIMITRLCQFLSQNPSLLEPDETFLINKESLLEMIQEVKEEKRYVSKMYQDMPFSKLAHLLLDYMESFHFIKSMDHAYKVYPLIRSYKAIIEESVQVEKEQTELFGGAIYEG